MSKEREIIKAIVEIANDKGSICFAEDWGENTLTIVVGNAHTHCGCPDSDLNTLIDSLHGTLVEGRGLSWVKGRAK